MQGNPTPTPASIGAQPAAATLTTLAGLAPADGNFIVGNGTTWIAESGSTARDSLALGTAAILNTGTTEGTIPLLGAGGRLDKDRLPSSLTLSLTLRSGFVARAGNDNRLTIFPDGFAELHFGVTNTTVPAGSTIMDWTSYPALAQVVSPSYFSLSNNDTVRAYINSGESALRFQRLSGSASTVEFIGQIRFRWA